MLAGTIFYFLVGFAGSVLFMGLRNVWLFNQLMKLSDSEVLSIKYTYDQMILRVWVWDVRKFLPG